MLGGGGLVPSLWPPPRLLLFTTPGYTVRVAVPGMEPGALAAMRLRPSGTPLRRLGGLSYQASPPFALSGGTDHRPFPNGPAYALYNVQTNQTATDAAKAGALVAVDTAIILV